MNGVTKQIYGLMLEVSSWTSSYKNYFISQVPKSTFSMLGKSDISWNEHSDQCQRYKSHTTAMNLLKDRTCTPAVLTSLAFGDPSIQPFCIIYTSYIFIIYYYYIFIIIYYYYILLLYIIIYLYRKMLGVG